MRMMNKGGIFIVSGPSGSGKDTILVELFKKCPELAFSISSITRPMREGEVEGQKYNFISREAFEEMIATDNLLEYNVFVGNYYGTPRAPVISAVESGQDIVIEVDVNGAAKIREKLPEVISVFIMPPSLKELKRRLVGRGTEDKELVEKRLEAALEEISRAVEYDYIVVNDHLDEAVNDLITIINASKLETKRHKNIINEVTAKC